MMSELPQRLFIALPLPTTVQRRLAELQQALAGAERLVRWAEPAAAHLTLQFLGATPIRQRAALQVALAAVISRWPALALQTADLGSFPAAAAQTQVLWLGLAGELAALGGLQAAVVAATSRLGWVSERRPYAPHITLGRVSRTATAAERLALRQRLGDVPPLAPIGWRASEVVLLESRLSATGARYSLMAGWSLAGGGQC